MRGEKEKYCLDRVRRQLNVKNSFGLSEDEFRNIEYYLSLATSNHQNNNFPDFLFEEGFIEHFQISSSCERRKGSEHIRKTADFHRTCDRKLDELASANNKAEVRASMQFRGHSHDNLIVSFIRNWECHLDSLKNVSQPVDPVSIFMVQYSDMALQMHGECYAPLGKGCSPISDCDTPNGYKLSRDKILLQYIQQHKEIIKYVIFVNVVETEIIAIDHIGARRTELLPWDYIVFPGHSAGFYIGSSFSMDRGSETE